MVNNSWGFPLKLSPEKFSSWQYECGVTNGTGEEAVIGVSKETAGAVRIRPRKRKTTGLSQYWPSWQYGHIWFPQFGIVKYLPILEPKIDLKCGSVIEAKRQNIQPFIFSNPSLSFTPSPDSQPMGILYIFTVGYADETR
jgi:hypothetical protein